MLSKQTMPKIHTIAFVVVLLLGARLQAQIAEQDLPPDSYRQIAIEALSQQELESRFEEAERTFLQDAQAEAGLPRLTELLELLEARWLLGPGQELRALLARSLGLRAQIRFNLGDESAVDRDLARLIQVDPAFEFDPALVSPKLLARFAPMREREVGLLQLTIQPPDADVAIDGQLVVPVSAGLAALAGTRTITARRPGYADLELTLEVRPGRKTPLDLVMERNSAMLLLVSRPAGAKVLVDGVEVGMTEGSAPDDYPLGDAANRFPRKEFSAPLEIGGVLQGRHRLEAIKEGFRPFRVQLDVPDLRDYNVGVALLEPTRGTVLLRGLPRGARVTVEDVATETVPVNARDARLQLSPGKYRLAVRDSASGFFETRIEVEDQKTVELSIELRPALTFLGILGGDRTAASRLEESLASASQKLVRWTVRNRADQAAPLLAGLGFEPRALRQIAQTGADAETFVNWNRLRDEADRTLAGSLYALAVLSDDLLADAADIWLLPTTPAPANPDLRRIALVGGRGLEEILSALDRPLEFERAWLGARLIASNAATGLVVIEVTEQGPAARAGILPGEEILSVLGQTVGTVAELERLIAEQKPNSSLSVQVQGVAGARVVDLVLGRSPKVVPTDSSELIYAALSASLASLAANPEDGTPAWLVELNQAAIHLHGGGFEGAVRILRGIKGAPKSPGLGQAAVDYWLAIALEAIGPEYFEAARQALDRAVAIPGGRLFHHDGPLVAPRARIRREALGPP